jgi:hypothetical protein
MFEYWLDSLAVSRRVSGGWMIGWQGSLQGQVGPGGAISGQRTTCDVETTGLTFMWISLAKSSRLGGCSNNTPCNTSNVDIMRRSFCPLLPFPISRSKHEINLNATFHWKLCCSLKNSLNAGSSFMSPSFFVGPDIDCPSDIIECLLLAAVHLDRHICARSPSTCRRPLRIFCAEDDER